MTFEQRKNTILTAFNIPVAAIAMAKMVNGLTKEPQPSKISLLEKHFKYGSKLINKCKSEDELKNALKNIENRFEKLQTNNVFLNVLN